MQGYSRCNDGYLLHGMLEAGIYISEKFPLIRREPDTFISADFAGIASLDKQQRCIILNGSSSAAFGVVEGKAVVSGGVLDCRQGGLLVGRSNFDCVAMTGPKTAMLEFTLRQLPGKQQDWAGLLTWGHFGVGFRMIVWHEKLFVQIFGDDSVYLSSREKLESGKKYLAVFNMNDKISALYINGMKQMSGQAVTGNRISIRDPLCVGCSYLGGMGKYSNAKIHRFAVWNRYMDVKAASR